MKNWQTKSVSICLFLAVVGATAKYVSARVPQRADEASTGIIALTPKQRMEIKKYDKVGNSLSVTINPVSGSVQQAGDAVTLEGVITVSANQTNVHYRWNFPEGITSSSVIEGDLGAMVAGATQTVHFEAVSATAENQTIHLSVIGESNGTKLIQAAQYNTVTQARIETTAYNKLQSLKLQAVQAKTKYKIMQ